LLKVIVYCVPETGIEAIMPAPVSLYVYVYKHLVRSHLEYNDSVWAPYRKLDIDKLEKVQKRATKMIQGIWGILSTQRD